MRFELLHLLPKRPPLFREFTLRWTAALSWRFLGEWVVSGLLETAYFAKPDALVEQFSIVFLQFAVGVSEVLVQLQVVRAPVVDSHRRRRIKSRLCCVL